MAPAYIAMRECCPEFRRRELERRGGVKGIGMTYIGDLEVGFEDGLFSQWRNRRCQSFVDSGIGVQNVSLSGIWQRCLHLCEQGQFGMKTD